MQSALAALLFVNRRRGPRIPSVPRALRPRHPSALRRNYHYPLSVTAYSTANIYYYILIFPTFAAVYGVHGDRHFCLTLTLEFEL